jgi:hypothetical protein
LLSQFLSKYWREVLQFLYVLRFTEERESELMGLLKLAIVDFKSFHGRKPAGENVKDFGIEP